MPNKQSQNALVGGGKNSGEWTNRQVESQAWRLPWLMIPQLTHVKEKTTLVVVPECFTMKESQSNI